MVAGSRAYGLATESSDLDVKGAVLPNRAMILGRQTFNQADAPEHFAHDAFVSMLSPDLLDVVRRSKAEGSMYNLVKFVTLLMENNPNIPDVLFGDDRNILKTSPLGEELRAMRGEALSTRCRHSLSGYAAAQMKRIKLHRRWFLDPPKAPPDAKDFGVTPESTKKVELVEAAMRDIVKSWSLDLSSVGDKSERQAITQQMVRVMTEQMGAIVKGDESFLGDADISKDVIEHAAMRSLGLDSDLQEVLLNRRRFERAKEQWRNYQRWLNDRNRDRHQLEEKYGYDTKHGMHLVRLLRVGMEVMTTGKFLVDRSDIDRDELLSIRAGEWSYDRLLEYSEDVDAKLQSFDDSKAMVPKSPNREKFAAWLENVLARVVVEESRC